MYSQLEDLLAAGKWREANRETRELLHKAAGDKGVGPGISYVLMREVPDTAMSDIDHLWKKYSNNHFGFSVQKGIWDKLYSDTLSLESTYSGFITTIGLRDSGYTSYWYCERSSEIRNPNIFSLEAPQGHLPMLQEWDIESVDDPYQRGLFPTMIETMSMFFARVPRTGE
jgi:hypothetical protein